MKTGIILTSVLAIITFATAANAQPKPPVKRGVETVAVLLNSTTVGVSIPAGKTLRFKPGKDTIRDSALLASFYAFDSAYSAPCGAGSGARAIGVSTATLTITGTLNDPMYHWDTNPAWKGTCRVLTVKFRDGGQARARVNFQ